MILGRWAIESAVRYAKDRVVFGQGYFSPHGYGDPQSLTPVTITASRPIDRKR